MGIALLPLRPLLHEGKSLQRWHHLVCGDSEAVHRAGVSIRGKTIPEHLARTPHDLPEHVIHWIRL